MRPSQIEESLRYDFSNDELLILSRQLAHERGRAIAIEEEKKIANAQYKEWIDKHEAEVTRIAALVRNGFEHRWITCAVHYNDPQTGEKSLYRTDTGELVKTVPMTPEERQEELPITDQVPKDEPAPALFVDDETAAVIMEKVADAKNDIALHESRRQKRNQRAAPAPAVPDPPTETQPEAN